jgi:dTDP-4-dehydrorhamnose reductase
VSAILLTGGTGQLGLALRDLAWPEPVTLFAPGRDVLDLSDPASVRAIMAARPFTAVINAGAYTAVDKAESDVEAAWRINALAPAVFAEETARRGIPLVQLSTDYVFPGTMDRPYREDDAIGPLSVYGASKEAGEQAVRTVNPRHAVLRTSWVIGPDGRNFLRTMLRAGAERPLLRVVDDQQGRPTVAGDLAHAVQVVTLALIVGQGSAGTYHVTNRGETTWCGLAREIFRVSAGLGGPVPAVEPIGTSDYPTPARRPANSRLDTARIEAVFGVSLPPWESSVARAVRACLEGRSRG